MRKTYNSIEELKEDFKDFNEFRNKYEGELVEMSRNTFNGFGGNIDKYYTRSDVNDDEVVVRCAYCGSEIISANFTGSDAGYVDEDGDFIMTSEGDTCHDSYTCSCCGDIVGSFADGSYIQY